MILITAPKQITNHIRYEYLLHLFKLHKINPYETFLRGYFLFININSIHS